MKTTCICDYMHYMYIVNCNKLYALCVHIICILFQRITHIMYTYLYNSKMHIFSSHIFSSLLFCMTFSLHFSWHTFFRLIFFSTVTLLRHICIIIFFVTHIFSFHIFQHYNIYFAWHFSLYFSWCTFFRLTFYHRNTQPKVYI